MSIKQLGASVGLGLAAAAVVAVPSASAHANHPAHLFNNTVNSIKIVNQSIQSIDIAAQAVGTSEIRDQTIQKIDIGANAVGGSEIVDQDITSVDIAADGVGSSEIAADAVGTSEIATDGVAAAEIAADAVGSSEIAAGAVGSSELADGTVADADTNGALTGASLAADTLVAGDIATGGVATAEILDGTIADADTNGALTGASLAADTLVAGDIATGGVATAEILDGTIAAADLAADIEVGSTITRATGATGSFQNIWADLTYEGGAGGTSYYHGGMMGNFLGSALTNTTSSLHAGVIGSYNVTTSDANTGASAGLIGEVGDLAAGADAAVMAVLGGDGGVTTPNAAYGVQYFNSTAGSKFDYGLDLSHAATADYGASSAVDYGTADIRLAVGTTISSGATNPTAACVLGSLFLNTTDAKLYVCTVVTPTWTVVGTQT